MIELIATGPAENQKCHRVNPCRIETIVYKNIRGKQSQREDKDHQKTGIGIGEEGKVEQEKLREFQRRGIHKESVRTTQSSRSLSLLWLTFPRPQETRQGKGRAV